MSSDLAYAPFGETYAEAGTPDRSFTGENQDTTPGSTTGLYDFMFREYAQYGRWISPDPAGLAAVDPSNPQIWNRYAYVANNPLSSVDPLGLECEQPCPPDVDGGGGGSGGDGGGPGGGEPGEPNPPDLPPGPPLPDLPPPSTEPTGPIQCESPTQCTVMAAVPPVDTISFPSGPGVGNLGMRSLGGAGFSVNQAHDPLWVCFTLALGFALAYVCGLDGLLFFVGGLAFWFGIHVAAAPLVYRLLPKRLVAPTGTIQSLGIGSGKH